MQLVSAKIEEFAKWAVLFLSLSCFLRVQSSRFFTFTFTSGRGSFAPPTCCFLAGEFLGHKFLAGGVGESS